MVVVVVGGGGDTTLTLVFVISRMYMSPFTNFISSWPSRSKILGTADPVPTMKRSPGWIMDNGLGISRERLCEGLNLWL